MSPQQIAVLVVAVTLGLLVVLLLLYGRPRRTFRDPTPSNFSTGDPDSVLEGPRLAKVQIWGVASAIFITGFLAIYFVVEPFREAAYSERFLEASVERGHELFLEGAACAACHGPDGTGGFAATDPDWPAPPLVNVFARYSRIEVERIIQAGRPGTPMPSWAIEYGGPLNPQKIEDVLNYLESIQAEERFDPDVGEGKRLDAGVTGREVFDAKCAVCHGDNAQGQALGKPLPSFFAPDLTTEFYRLGLDVKRNELARQIEISKDAPATAEEVEAALALVPASEILEAGEEASRNTILLGRTNTPMPGWQNRIMPEHIDAVVDFLRSIQTVPSG